MPRARNEAEVSLAPDRVFDFIATNFFENHRRWDPTVLELTREGIGPMAAGVKGREVRKAPGGTEQASLEVTRFEAPTHFAFHLVSKAANVDVSYSLEKTATGTRLVHEISLAPRGAFVLLSLIFGVVLRKQSRADLARLVALLSQ